MTTAARPLHVLYRDEHLVVVDKPADLLVHRSELDPDRDAALQRVRDQIGCRVYPVHRLDRATSGALAFALSPAVASDLAAALAGPAARKCYLAVVRGWPPESGVINRPLNRSKGGERRPARTRFRRLATVQLDIPVAHWPTARYALVAAVIETGRRHQIRRHLNGIAHPVVGDTTHGDGRHNRLFREHLGCRRLLLHAWGLAFPHPHTGDPIVVTAPLPEAFRDVGERLGWDLSEPALRAALGDDAL